MARRPPPVSAGLKGRCPECGEGQLFNGFLKFSNGCEACGADFRDEDAGDGPTVFVIFIVGIFIIPMALAFQLITDAPTWLTLTIWIPIIILVPSQAKANKRGIAPSIDAKIPDSSSLFDFLRCS